MSRSCDGFQPQRVAIECQRVATGTQRVGGKCAGNEFHSLGRHPTAILTTYIIQQYIHDPLLLDGYKWDMRLYVLVTSFQPKLEAYLYKEGFARFATVRYSTEDLSNNMVHLTNTSIQKHNERNVRQTQDTLVGGTKISLKVLREKLQTRNPPVNFERLWEKIIDCVLKSLCCARDHIGYCPNAFESRGFYWAMFYTRGFFCGNGERIR